MIEREIFEKPVLINRENGSMPKTNFLLGDIDSVFDTFDTDSFHFFTKQHDKNGNYFIPLIWKVLLLKNNNYKIKVAKELINYIGKDKLLREISIYNNYSLNLQYIIFYDNVDWHTVNQKIFVVSFKNKKNKIKSKVKLLTKTEFEKYLFSIQNESMVMNKPLIYSTTNLERYLSDMCQRELCPQKRAIFPGDVDCLIYKENKVRYLIEFKKHTIKGKIENQSFKKYWDKDKKKYTALASLAKYFHLNYFINLIYSTFDDINKIKLEIISSNLKLLKTKIISFITKDELINLLKDIFK